MHCKIFHVCEAVTDQSDKTLIQLLSKYSKALYAQNVIHLGNLLVLELSHERISDRLIYF